MQRSRGYHGIRDACVAVPIEDVPHATFYVNGAHPQLACDLLACARSRAGKTVSQRPASGALVGVKRRGWTRPGTLGPST